MAVAKDATSRFAGTGTGNLSWTHTPTGTPRGILVWVVQNNGSDQVSGVTYGGVAMEALPGGPVEKAGGEALTVACFGLRSSIPTGAQTVDVTVSGSAAKTAFCVSVTAAGDTTFLPIGTISSNSVTDPSVTVGLLGRSAFVAIGFCSGQDAFSGITQLTGWTGEFEVDFGTTTGGFYTYNTVDTADVSAGWTQTADDAVGIAVAITEAQAFTLTAAAGSFTLTGQAAGLAAGRLVTAVTGSFSLSGSAAGLTAARLLGASAGSFALTGAATGLLAARRLTAATGSFSLTGPAAGLMAQRRLTAATGTFTLTGSDATLTYGSAGGYVLVAATGTFALTGAAAGLVAARRLTAVVGSFALTGGATGLLAGRRLTAAAGSFSLSGATATLTAARRLTAGTGVFVLTGNAAALTASGTTTYTIVRATDVSVPRYQLADATVACYQLTDQSLPRYQLEDANG